uniref:CSON009245 protein n=1 Tax=Culicoides sonorensis TaxID=179676 RepID=A0A336MXM7_CULSO
MFIEELLGRRHTLQVKYWKLLKINPIKMELFAKYSCTNCQEEITGIRIHCAECPDYDSCLNCYSSGAQIGEHESDHSYQFMNSTGTLPLFKGNKGWSPTEELHLLDAIEQFGFGNWEDIARHIETRSADEARDKYIEKYLDSPIGRYTWEPEAEKRPVLIDHTLEEDEGPLGPKFTSKLPPLDITMEEALHVGYMAHRDDFEREYDTTAEKLVSVLALDPDDEEEDLLLKLAQIDIYQRRIRERARRKRLARDYQLAANFFRGYIKRLGQSRDQREFRERLRTFAQFYTCNEFERLVNSLERERSLRIRLSELNRYRYNGIQKIEETVHFEYHVATYGRYTGPYGHGKTHCGVIGPNGERLPGIWRQIFMGQPRLRRLRQATHHAEAATSSPGTRRKKRRNRLKFHRPKNHVAHRRPGLIRRLIAHSKLLCR